MSEFQYYEFRAVDKPLDRKTVQALGAVSSRAEITPTRLVVIYNYGNFRGKPEQLLEEHFDAFLYVANWGTRRLALRLRRRQFDAAVVLPYLVPPVVSVASRPEHVILDFQSSIEESSWESEEQTWLDSLTGLRNELIAGDLRCLYIAWLAALLNSGEVDDEEEEPPVPPGLGSLSEAQKVFADFMRVDEKLLEIAAAASYGTVPSGPSVEQVATWVAGLPQEDKDAALVRVVRGEALAVGQELSDQYRQAQPVATAVKDRAAPRRTGAELLQAFEAALAEEERLAEEEAARKQAEAARRNQLERARHLQDLAGREKELWQLVETRISTKVPEAYDLAITLMQDLREVAEQAGTGADAATRIREVRERHKTKRALIKRMNAAGLPK